MPKSRAVTKLWPPITGSVKQVVLGVLSADVAQADSFLLEPPAEAVSHQHLVPQGNKTVAPIDEPFGELNNVPRNRPLRRSRQRQLIIDEILHCLLPFQAGLLEGAQTISTRYPIKR
jgi:hypothetical protein